MNDITQDEHAELHALNEEFTVSETMTVEMFTQRRKQIEIKYRAIATAAALPLPANVTPAPLQVSQYSRWELKVAHDEHKAAIASRDGERIKASIKLPAFAASLLHYAQGVVNKFGANAAVTFALANIEATEAKLQIALARIKTLEQSGANGTSKFSLPVYDEGKIIGSQQLSADDLIKELTALRAAKSTDVDAGFSYGGTWNEAKESRAGIYYTQGGSLWHCNNNTRDRPGTSDKFTLAVKKGEAERLRA